MFRNDIFFGRKSLGGLICPRATTVGAGDGMQWLQIAAATKGWCVGGGGGDGERRTVGNVRKLGSRTIL